MLKKLTGTKKQDFHKERAAYSLCDYACFLTCGKIKDLKWTAQFFAAEDV